MFPTMFAVALISCSHAKSPATTPLVSAAATGPAKPLPPPAAAAVTPRVTVSDDVARACSVHLDNVAAAPKFAFDNFQLLPADRNVLEQVATCITRGPLRGRSLRLVGHTDPRGTDEYNLALGDRRATAVGEYLMRLGVPNAQLQETTRGEIDATGGDEGAWTEDRRVDLTLATR